MINSLLDNKLHRSVLFVISILKCPMGEMKSVLDGLNVRALYHDSLPNQDTRTRMIPQVGQPVSDVLVEHIYAPPFLDHIPVGEYVAYRNNAGDIIDVNVLTHATDNTILIDNGVSEDIEVCWKDIYLI